MTIQEYDSVDDNDAPMFGTLRSECHFPLLAAAVTADLDVLLPCLFFACSEHSLDDIFDKTSSMTREVLRILIGGRERLDHDVNRLVSDLPARLRRALAASCAECQRVKEAPSAPCLLTAYYSKLPDLIQAQFRTMKGTDVVEEFLSPVCEGCSSFVARMIDRDREGIWNKVPPYHNSPERPILQTKLKDVVGS